MNEPNEKVEKTAAGSDCLPMNIHELRRPIMATDSLMAVFSHFPLLLGLQSTKSLPISTKFTFLSARGQILRRHIRTAEAAHFDDLNN